MFRVATARQFDPLTGRFVLVLEDLRSADNCEFPDTLHPIDADRAALVVELLARLHATFWAGCRRTGAGPLGWLYTASADSATRSSARC